MIFNMSKLRTLCMVAFMFCFLNNPACGKFGKGSDTGGNSVCLILRKTTYNATFLTCDITKCCPQQNNADVLSLRHHEDSLRGNNVIVCLHWF